jgi:predicted DNA-binding protein (UPF0251 family)
MEARSQERHTLEDFIKKTPPSEQNSSLVSQESNSINYAEPRFEKEIGEEELKQIRILSEHGARQETIAALLGISRATYQRMLKKHDKVREASEYGKARGEAKIIKNAFEMAQGKEHPWFTKFWLQVNAGWQTEQRIEITGKGGGPIQIQEMSPDERRERINQLLELREKLGIIDVTPTKEKDDNGSDTDKESGE